MTRTFRKLGKNDFQARLKRIDGLQGGHGGSQGSNRRDKPLFSALLGFGWFYAALGIGMNKTKIEASLAQGNLAANVQTYIVGILAVLLIITAVMLCVHVFRFVVGGRARRNSGGLVMGAIGAIGFVSAPPELWSLGYDLLDNNAQMIVYNIQNTIADTGVLEVANLR